MLFMTHSSAPETVIAASSNGYTIFLTPCPDCRPAAATGCNFSTPLIQPHLPRHRLQTLLHFVHLPLCQMAPLHSKRDVWCLEYYLTETAHGQDVGRFVTLTKLQCVASATDVLALRVIWTLAPVLYQPVIS